MPAVSLERVFADPPLDGRRPLQAHISPGGHWVSFLKPSLADSEVLELWAQALPNGESRRLVSAIDLLAGAAQKLTEAEKMALERKRISQRGITGYSWCGEDDSSLLFPLSGDLYLARLTDTGPVASRLTHDDDVPEQDPACAPDGSRVAYVKSGNLVVHDLKSDRARAVTTGATKTRFHGLAEFIAGEELGRFEGFWWSRDGRRLLVLTVDESGVGEKTRAQIFADRTELFTQRYPAAGEKNAIVTASVVDVATGGHMPIPLPKNAEYVARGGFFADGSPWLQVLTRDQTKLTLLEADPRTGRSRVVLQDVDDAWVEVHDDLRELPGLSLSGRPALLWSTESSGRKELVLVDRVTGARSPLSSMAEPVDEIVCTDGRRVVFSSHQERGRSTELFVVDAVDTAHATTPVAGGRPHRTRGAVADRGCQRLLVTTSTWGEPPTSSIVDVDGRDAPLPVPGDPPDPLLARVVTEPIAVDVVAADGKTPLNAFYLPPLASSTAQPRHPVIVHAYGGPTGAVVGWRWSRQFGVFTHWRQRGFGVFLVDTRGMAHRDRAFTRAHKNAFGKVEIDDLFAAVRQLPERVTSVDATRLGFFGWSYGGTVAARAVLDERSPFAAAVAVAPVTDWRLYDTAYTERYLGLPTMPDGSASPVYAQANLVSRAAQLSRPLLLVHGTADDNVLFEHSLRLMEALQNEGRTFDTAIYPGKAHGIAGKKAQLHVYKTTTAFFFEHLMPR
jgi:dipeptidyl-peptidase-4